MNLTMPQTYSFLNLFSATTGSMPASPAKRTSPNREKAERRAVSPNGEYSVFRYLTLSELRSSLLALDNPGNTTAIVVLDEHFKGHLPSLIERPEAAFRLVLVSLSGVWSSSVAHLVLHSHRLGWDWIACERSASAALHGALVSRREDENIVVFWPSGHDLQAIEA